MPGILILLITMLNSPYKTFGRSRGLTLLETLTAMVIAGMILAVLLMVYDRARSSAMAVTRNLDKRRLPTEILQRIAEDMDRLLGPGAETFITIRNKIDEGYQSAQLTISNRIFDADDNPLAFERIIWQTTYDPQTDTLTLYRSQGGLAGQDAMAARAFVADPQPGVFVPLCSGVTLFKVQGMQDEKLLDSWSGSGMIPAVLVTLSFAQPYEAITGEWDVPEEDKISRTIAINRTRQPKFKIDLQPEKKEN